MKSFVVCAPHSSHQTGKVRWTGHLAYAGKKKGVQVCVGMSEGKKPHGKPSCRRENIKTYRQEERCEIMDRTNFGQGQGRGKWLGAVTAVVKLRVP
jgi:hypothetical protein